MRRAPVSPTGEGSGARGAPLDVLHGAARRVGADPREVLAAVAIARIDDAALDDATAEAVLLGVRELRKLAGGAP